MSLSNSLALLVVLFATSVISSPNKSCCKHQTQEEVDQEAVATFDKFVATQTQTVKSMLASSIRDFNGESVESVVC